MHLLTRSFLYILLSFDLLRRRLALGLFAGPYFMNVRELSNCPKNEVDNQLFPPDLNVRSVIRYNHTTKIHIIDANITVGNGMFKRGASQMSLDIARWDTVSGWREHFLVMPLGELCFVYEEIATDIVKLLAQAAQVPTKCPIADGTYMGGNTQAKVAPLRHFPSLPYGRYRVYTMYLFPAKMYKHSSVRGCMRLIVDVVPQKDFKRRTIT